ncbi:MAG: Protoporphyrinogen oxidase [Pseudomonadota bacterium]
MNVALIGAGAAGAACVSVLRSRRADFCVFEKARGAGGRLATRRVSGILSDQDLSYDHGAPSFEWPHSLAGELKAVLSQQTVQPISETLFVSAPHMPHLVKELLADGKVKTQCEIDVVERCEGKWFLVEKQLTPAAPANRHGPFDALVITAPAPQAKNILRQVSCSWKSELDRIEYHPCWALMLSVKGQLHLPNGESLPHVQSVTAQQSKPLRAQHSQLTSWVIHMTPEWSRMNLEADAAAVLEQLLDHLLPQLSCARGDVVHATAHRWRYSTVAQSLGCTLLADRELQIYYSSDGCGSETGEHGVAAAVRSGLRTGQMLLEHSRS